MNKKMVLLAALIFSTAPLSAEELIRNIAFTTSIEVDAAPYTVVDDTGAMIISGPEAGAVLPLLNIDSAGLTSPVYAVRGFIKYENVGGDGYLQLDNTFKNSGTFFTRSLAEAGPLGKLSGSSGWREFTLPFYANADGDDEWQAPTGLRLSVNLPGGGSVYLKDVALYQYAKGENPIATGGAGKMLGMIGALFGTVVGLWGAAIGTLSGLGRARRFVSGSLIVLPAIGAAMVIYSGTLFTKFNSPILGIFFFVGGAVLVSLYAMRRTIIARYEDLELRKIDALDA